MFSNGRPSAELMMKDFKIDVIQMTIMSFESHQSQNIDRLLYQYFVLKIIRHSQRLDGGGVQKAKK